MQNHHADSLSRLLTGSPTVDDEEDEIPSFLLENVNYDLYLDTPDPNATMDFIENDFVEDEQLLVFEERKDLSLKVPKWKNYLPLNSTMHYAMELVAVLMGERRYHVLTMIMVSSSEKGTQSTKLSSPTH